jgi:hypothetical protein
MQMIMRYNRPLSNFPNSKAIHAAIRITRSTFLPFIHLDSNYSCPVN